MFRVRASLFLGFGAALVAAAAVALVSYFSLHNLVSARAELAQGRADDLSDVAEIRSLFEQVSAETRGYFLTANPIFLGRSERLHARLRDHFVQAENSLLSAATKDLLKEAERLIASHKARAELEFRRFESDPVRRADAFETELHPLGMAVRKNLDALVRQKQDRLSEARSQAERAVSIAATLIVTVAALAIVLATTLAFVISHTVSRLYGRIDSLARRLVHLSQDLKRSNEELEQFAYVASHDLREPLRTMRNIVQLLERKFADRVDREGMEYMQFVASAALRLQNLVDALLEYARAESRPLKKQRIDTNQLMGEVLDGLRSTIAETRARIEIPRPLPGVEGDAMLLAQLFQNLVANAIKYRKEQSPRVEVSFVAGATEVRFSVRDNGIGFPPDQAERIFEVFRRLHGRNEYEGVGIGLALCRRIVERHGGRIWAESSPGQGSTFHFTLPSQWPSRRGDSSQVAGLERAAS